MELVSVCVLAGGLCACSASVAVPEMVDMCFGAEVRGGTGGTMLVSWPCWR